MLRIKCVIITLCFMSKMDTEVTTGKAAAITGVARKTILNHIEKGKLSARKRLNAHLIQLSELKRWAKSQGLKYDESKL